MTSARRCPRLFLCVCASVAGVLCLSACRSASSAGAAAPARQPPRLPDLPPVPLPPRPSALPVQTRRATPEQESQLLLLSNACATVGLSPRLAGRIMLYRQADGPNVLLSDPDHWGAQPEGVPEVTLEAEFRPFNGHIVWLGPQEAWWTQQQLNEERRKRGPIWPPDPYLLYSPFRVVTQRLDVVQLEGPVSPVSGMRLLKELRLEADGGLVVTVSATNMRQAPVSWGLWSNTRLPGRARCYVPVEGTSSLRIEWQSGDPTGQRMLEHDIVGGCFTFRSDVPLEAGISLREATACVAPQRGVMAGFHSGQVLLKHVPLFPATELYPSQSSIEIHQRVAPDEADCLLELGNHGAYRTLQPGERLTLTERWSLHDYPGPDSVEAQVAFLHTLLDTPAPPGGEPPHAP